jgi:hypothetical protein
MTVRIAALAVAVLASLDVAARAPFDSAQGQPSRSGQSQGAVRPFIPESFYNTFSFAHPPALRIKPGERIVTKTADASGVDWNGKTVAQGPNPQTGPFFVEGAEPGDMLVVSIDKLELNRASAYSSSLLAPYAVDPAALMARVDREPRRVNWILDKARGVARLDGDDIQGIELPVRPMSRAAGSLCAGESPFRQTKRGDHWRCATRACRPTSVTASSLSLLHQRPPGCAKKSKWQQTGFALWLKRRGVIRQWS